MRLTLSFFFFNDTATTEIYTLSLHDALPISGPWPFRSGKRRRRPCRPSSRIADRKSTRLNSSHVRISYAVFCLKKKKKEPLITRAAGSKTAHPLRGEHVETIALPTLQLRVVD